MKCKYCNTELTRDEKRNCLVCLACNPPQKTKPDPPKEETKYLDVHVTEKRVAEIVTEQEEWFRKIIRDELENWYIPKPSTAKEDVESQPAEDLDSVVQTQSDAATDANWRAQAKALGIPLFQRKKEAVLADIAKKTKSPE